LSRRIKDDEIREKFSKVGKVVDINVIRDPFTQDTRGFGFVTMESSKEAQAATELLNKTELDHRQVTVEFSKRSRPHESTPGIYLGPTVRKRISSPNFKRRYRSKSRSRSRSYHKEKNYRRNK
jgi:transformer-2 protein